MIALIDGDILCYRAGFACQKIDEEGELRIEPLPNCLHTVKSMLENILGVSGASGYLLFLTGKNNFRMQVDPMYKHTRKDAAKPAYYSEIREYMERVWGADVVDGMEADDALGMNQSEGSFIASIDKDLLMVEGLHYNFVKDEWKEVSAEEGTRHFYTQMLTGDSIDAIPGCKGVGPVKAGKLLDSSDNWDATVYDTYKEHFENPLERMKMNAQLLWILQRDKTIPINFEKLV